MTGITRFADRVTETAARQVTRRRLLRNAGGVALGTTMTAAYFGLNAKPAAACDYSSVCGPSPLCPPTHCSGYNCNTGVSTVKWQKYAQGVCGTSGDQNCWSTCRNGNLWYCCDCCRQNASCGSTCTGCGSSGWKTCICHDIIGSC